MAAGALERGRHGVGTLLGRVSTGQGAGTLPWQVWEDESRTRPKGSWACAKRLSQAARVSDGGKRRETAVPHLVRQAIPTSALQAVLAAHAVRSASWRTHYACFAVESLATPTGSHHACANRP